MSDNRQVLLEQLEDSQRELQSAQNRVAALELQLRETGIPVTASLSHEVTYATFDSLLEGCQIIGFDWRYIFVNHTAATQGRRTQAELLGRTMMECYPGIDQTALFADLRCCMTDRQAMEMENEFVYPDGSKGWFELHIQPVPTGIFILSLDITKRKAQESTLQRYVQRMQILHEIDLGIISATSVIDVVDEALKHIRALFGCQQAAVVLFDFASTEIIFVAGDTSVPSSINKGDRYPMWSGIFEEFGGGRASIIDDIQLASDSNPSNRRVKREGMRSCLRVLLKIQGQSVGVLILNADTPHYFTVEHQEIAIEIADQISIAIQQLRLSESLSESEHRYRRVVEDQTELICRYKADLTLTFANRAYADAFGLTPETMIGRNLKDLIVPGDREAFLAHMATVLSSADMVVRESPYAYPDGTVHWVQWQDQALKDEYGQVFEYQGVGRDITARRTTELELEALYNATTYLLKADTLSSLANQIVEAVIKEFVQVDCGLLLVDREHNSIRRVVRKGVYDIQPDTELRLDSTGLVPLAIRTGETVYVPDVRLDPHYVPSIATTRSELVIPLKTARGVLAVLDLQHTKVDAFSQRDQRILVTYAERAAAALETMQLYDAVDRHAARLEQRVAERTEELQASKDRVEAILNNSPNAILLVKRDMRIQQANYSFQQLFSYNPNDDIPKTVTELVHADDVGRVVQAVQDSVDKERNRTVEVRARRSDDTTFEAELSVGHIKGNGFVCTFRDITERKTRERQLRYYASLQESVHDAVIAGDLQYRIQSWNKAAEQMYGWRAEEVIGHHIFEVMHDPSNSNTFREQAIQIVMSSGVWAGELIHQHKNGTNFHIQATATLLKDDDGQPIGMVTVNRDITERKAQERQLRFHASIQESVSDAVFMIDTNLHIQSWNKAAESIYGWRADEVIGQPAILIDTEFESEAEQVRFSTEIITKGSWQGEAIQKRKDGAVINVFVASTQVKDDNGNLMGLVTVNRDITERKRAEVALRDSEERFRQYFDLPLIGMAITSLEKGWLQVNDKLCDMFGYTREELVQKTWDEITYADDLESDVTQFNRIITGEIDGYVLDKRFVRKSGEIIYTAITARAVRNPDKQINYFVALVQDITARKKAEAAVRESEIRYRLLADNATDMVIRIDMYGDVLYVSPSVKLILGYDPAELIGCSAMIFIHPDDVTALAKMLMATQQGDWHNESSIYRARHKQGHYIWLEAIGKVIHSPETGEMEGIIASSRDISDRIRAEEALRESEERFRSIINGIQDYAIFMLSPDGRVMSWNPGAERIKGYSAQEIMGMHFEHFYTLEDQDSGKPQQVLEVAMTTGHYADEGWRVRKNGTRFWANVEISCLRDQNGNLIGFTKVVSDVTERKKAEEALKLALAKEKELSELKSRFVSMASHEFRTPLATILTLTESLTYYRQKMSDEQIQTRLGRIQEQINYLTEIMNDMLQLARLQARRAEYNPNVLDLAALCQQVIEEFTSRPAPVHRIEFTYAKELPLMNLDVKLMRQILNNLISNAIKYSSVATPIAIDLQCRETTIVLNVSDHGIGIPEADLEHLFEPFHRASNIGNIAGTGLGLTITKESVELHGGSIAIESQVGIGTTFSVILPTTLET